jgi:hypothetical protein
MVAKADKEMSAVGPSRRAWDWSRGPLSKGKRTKREISTTPPWGVAQDRS